MQELIPRPSMQRIIAVSDVIMPWAVILSIVGLILEYTFINEYGAGIVLGHGFVGLFNMIFDIFFAIDVILRTIAFSKSWSQFKTYIGKGLGWVDWLAAIPGFLIPVQIFAASGAGGEIFRQFKIMRIGKFLRIIRLLRVLRFFKFLEKMNKDSVFIQKHIMTLVLSITLMTIGAIAVMDTVLGVSEDTKNKMTALVFSDQTKDMSESEKIKFIEGNENLQKLEKYLIDEHDSGMLTILLLLTVLLLTIIFYFGPGLAKDVRRVQLVVDSVDADDYFLVQEELENVVKETGSADLRVGEDEMVSLIKIASKIPLKVEEINNKEMELDSREQLVQDKEEDLIKKENNIAQTIEHILIQYLNDMESQVPTDELASITGDLMSDMGGASGKLSKEEINAIADEAAIRTIKRAAKSFFDVNRKIIREELENFKKD